MGDVSLVRKGLDARLAAVVGLNAHSHTIPSSVPDTPFAYISIPMHANGVIYKYDAAYRAGAAFVNLSIVLLVSKVDDGMAQDTIDPFLGDDSTNTSSIYQAVMADQHLTYNNAATASSVLMSAAHSYGIHKVGQVDYLGCLFEVQVIPLKV